MLIPNHELKLKKRTRSKVSQEYFTLNLEDQIENQEVSCVCNAIVIYLPNANNPISLQDKINPMKIQFKC